MPRPPSKTAEELMAELSSDPAHQQTVVEQRARNYALLKEIEFQELVICSELRKLGYGIESVWDLVNNTPHPVLERRFLGPYPLAYPALVRNLALPHHPKVREGIIRALTVRDGGEPVWRALLAQFAVEERPDLRWVLSNALKVTMPYKERRKHPEIANVYKHRGAL